MWPFAGNRKTFPSNAQLGKNSGGTVDGRWVAVFCGSSPERQVLCRTLGQSALKLTAAEMRWDQMSIGTLILQCWKSP